MGTSVAEQSRQPSRLDIQPQHTFQNHSHLDRFTEQLRLKLAFVSPEAVLSLIQGFGIQPAEENSLQMFRIAGTLDTLCDPSATELARKALMHSAQRELLKGFGLADREQDVIDGLQNFVHGQLQ